MKVLFTINLENRSGRDADLLQAFVSDAVRSFAMRASSKTDVERVRLFADEFDPLAEFHAIRKRSSRRGFGHYTRPANRRNANTNDRLTRGDTAVLSQSPTVSETSMECPR